MSLADDFSLMVIAKMEIDSWIDEAASMLDGVDPTHLADLLRSGWVTESEPGRYLMTAAGYSKAVDILLTE